MLSVRERTTAAQNIHGSLRNLSLIGKRVPWQALALRLQCARVLGSRAQASYTFHPESRARTKSLNLRKANNSKWIKLYKDELIYLHQLFELMMELMVSNGVSEDCFKKYSNARMSSNYLYKTKEEHEHALLLLSSDLSKALASMYDEIPPSVSRRFEAFAENTTKRSKS